MMKSNRRKWQPHVPGAKSCLCMKTTTSDSLKAKKVIWRGKELWLPTWG